MLIRSSLALLASAAIATAGFAFAGTGESTLSMSHSHGQACSVNQAYQACTPPAPVVRPTIEQAGRTNIHSGGRRCNSCDRHGGDNRVGHGGGSVHPNHVAPITGGYWIQPLMTDGFRRNPGTRPHHPRASCRCI